MSEIVIVYAVFANAAEAQSIIRTAVEERLAACANVLGPCRSIYRWQGQVEEAEEIAAIFKTGADTAETLVARIAELHSYEVPAIAIWTADAHPPYADWVRKNSE